MDDSNDTPDLPPDARKYAMSQVVSTEHLTLGGYLMLLDELEARIIGDVARAVHEDGKKFLDWPRVQREPTTRPFKATTIRVFVYAVPR